MTRAYLAVLGILLAFLGGCVSNPTTPDQMREHVRAHKMGGKFETFEVQRPYSTVTQFIKRKSEDCINREFQITSKPAGMIVIGGAQNDGYTKYIAVSSITPKKAEFHAKFWDSKKRAVNTPAGDKFVFYVAEVTPKGKNATSIDLYSWTFDRYKWGGDLVRAWARGEDPGCPELKGLY
jgi:hypothetical protein